MVLGVAAMNGEADKLRRYGEHVTCLPIETFGIIALEAEEILWVIARLATRMNEGTSQQSAPDAEEEASAFSLTGHS